MAYYLQANRAYVEHVIVPLIAISDYRAVFTLSNPLEGTNVFAGTRTNISSFVTFISSNSVRVRGLGASEQTLSFPSGFTVSSEPIIVDITNSPSGLTISVTNAGVTETRTGNATGELNIESFLLRGDKRSTINTNLYRIQIYDSSNTLIHDYNPSSSNGTGSILPDDIGGNDGTLVNFTLPDAWQFYGAAGATYSLTFDPATYAYTGSDLSLLVSRSISFDAGNYSYSGVDLNLSASRNISFDTGSYAYTGNDISLLASRSISLDEGLYAYTGNDLTLTYNPTTGATYTLSFDAGNYLYSGNDLGLSLSRKLSLDTGNYSYSGNNQDLLASRKLAFDTGSYAYSGNDLTLTYTPATGATYFISLNAGSYLVSGNTIQLAANRALLLDAGSYELTGEPVTLATNRKLSLDAGSYAVTGNDVDLLANRSITLESGEYDYLGNPITLTYSGQIISLIDNYSVNYINDFVTASYANNYINAEFK